MLRGGPWGAKKRGGGEEKGRAEMDVCGGEGDARAAGRGGGDGVWQ